MKFTIQKYSMATFISLIVTLAMVTGVLAAAGALDPTFDGDGLVTTAVGAWNDQARAVAIQPDGKIVVVGGVVISLTILRSFATTLMIHWTPALTATGK